jgi:formylglycine-generating enzyme required for sulfatase activity
MPANRLTYATAVVVSALLGAASVAIGKCPPDAVQVGTTCVDKFEASVWQVPSASTKLIKKIQQGRATVDDLRSAGAIALGCALHNLMPYPATFPATGNWTEPVYAASVAGALPSTCLTWFQAEQACRLSGKRLVTNQEWQAAGAGTPDPGTDNGTTDCNVITQSPSLTGARSACVSKWGAFDMVGNAAEMVADWGPVATQCILWDTAHGTDSSCIGGGFHDGVTGFPSALERGGSYTDEDGGSKAGVFAARQLNPLGHAAPTLGFRCAR